MVFLGKIIEYGLYSLVFLLPVQARWIIKAGFTEYQTYSLYGTDILLILILLLFIVCRISNLIQNSKLRTQNLLAFGLFLASFISVFFAIDKVLAWYKLGWLILGVGLFWLIVSANYDRVKLIYALSVGIFFQAGLAVWQFLTQSSFTNKWLGLAYHNGADLGASVIETVGADGVGERWLRAYGGLDHPNMLGGLLVIGALILVGEIIKFGKFPNPNPPAGGQFPNNFQIPIHQPADNFQTISKLSKIFKITAWAFLAIFAAALFFSFSRAAWLALAVGCAIMLGGAFIKKNFQAQKSILQAILISGLVGFILFFQFSNLVMTRIYSGGRLEVKSVSERFASLKNSWPIIKNNWASGAGLGNYTLALNRQAPGQESFYYQPAHVVYLLVLSEVGIFGFIFFMGLIVYLIITNLEIRNWKLEIGGSNYENNSSFNISVLVSLIVLLSLDHWLWSLHFGVLFLWLILGIIAGSDKKLISI